MATMNDEFNMSSGLARAQYSRMVKLRDTMTDQLAELHLQKLENDICLIKEKQALYSYCDVTMTQIKLESLCKDVSDYLDALGNGEIKSRATKCYGKNRHQMLCDTIDGSTGIKVKQITKIIFCNMDRSRFEIEFVPLMSLKTKCRLTVPNLSSTRFSVHICDTHSFYTNKLTDRDITNALNDLETELSVITKETDWSTELTTIARFPRDTFNMTDFENALKSYILKGKEKK